MPPTARRASGCRTAPACCACSCPTGPARHLRRPRCPEGRPRRRRRAAPGLRAGPRAIPWQPGVPATLVWAEAQDGGDPRTRVAHQDRVVRLTAPFTDAPGVLAQLDQRYAGVVWDTAGLALLSEFDRERRWIKTWILHAPPTSRGPPLLWDRSAEDRYADPGTPVQRGVGAQRSLLRSGDWIYLAGAGASPQGERPFLDRLNLRTRRVERLWRAAPGPYQAGGAGADG